MKIIGLTGGIASGKSTVSNYLKRKDIKIVDADLISRELVAVGTKGLNQLIKKFGDDILNMDGSLNRKKMASIVFNSDEKLQLLNSILHPIIREEILHQFDIHRENGEEIVVFDCPLLFEGKYENICDETWLVSVSYETQLKRLTLRDNIDNVHAKKIINSQMSLAEKIKLSDIIINNESNVTKLYIIIDKLLEKHYK